MVKRLQKQIYIPDLGFGAKNLIFARNAVNTPPIFNTPRFSRRGGIYGEYNGILKVRGHQIWEWPTNRVYRFFYPNYQLTF